MPLQREDVYKGFRFTPYTTRKVLTWAVLVPGVVGYIVYTNLVRTTLRANQHVFDISSFCRIHGIGEANSKGNP